MRLAFTQVLTLVILVNGQLQAQGPLKVPDGTSLRLSLTETLSSATNEVDNPVHFEVT
jgi:hypothetical protein